MPIGKCALCGESAELEKSHIIPKFATDWIKKTGVTGKMLNNNVPTLRAQDGLKEYLLCGSCEDLFSKRGETPFATKIFHPFKKDKTRSFFYQEWLAFFVNSVQWRVLTVTLRKRQEQSIMPQNIINSHLLLSAEEGMRNYLLDRNELPKFVRHHFYIPNPALFIPIAEYMPEAFITRSTIAEVIEGPNWLYIFSNIAGIFLITVLTEFPGIKGVPAALPDRWLTTQIFKQGVTQSNPWPPSMFLLGRLGHIIKSEQRRKDYTILNKMSTAFDEGNIDRYFPEKKFDQSHVQESLMTQLALFHAKRSMGFQDDKMDAENVFFKAIVKRNERNN